MMKAEQYLNVGYQRLLTFEHKTGGFDWWGQESNEPLIWVSAYGLQEFNDMAKVYPIDRGVIDRTQAWLLKQQAADGTWEKIGMTHNETIASMGDPKLLLTSYVTWSLLDSGLQVAAAGEVDRLHPRSRQGLGQRLHPGPGGQRPGGLGRQGRRTHDVLVRVLKKLDAMQQDKPEWKAIAFPANGQSLAYARGESLTVETTALAVLAMLKNGQFPNDVNKALVVPGEVEGPQRHVGQHVGDDPVAEGADPAAGGSAAEGHDAVHDRRSTARRRPRARSPSRTPT